MISIFINMNNGIGIIINIGIGINIDHAAPFVISAAPALSGSLSLFSFIYVSIYPLNSVCHTR